MRLFLLILLVMLSSSGAAEAGSAAGRKYFDMPVSKWLRLSGREQAESARTLLSLNREEVSPQQSAGVVSCMKAIGASPVWEGSTVGTLLTKCSFDMGVAKSPSEKEWDAIVTCVQNEVPDFSKEELFALGLSAAGASLAKDSGTDPILTPRTRRVLEVIDGCGKR